MEGLEGKKALVTGSSRGIGACIALHLASEGMHVALTYSRSKDRAQEVYKSLPGSGHLLLSMDVGDLSSIQQAFSQIQKNWGVLHALVNNAGVNKDRLLLRLSEEDFSTIIQTNLMGTFFCSKEALRLLSRSGGGSIVNISSAVARMGSPGQSCYAASKAGVEAMGRCLAREMASRNIRVNSVAPGFIESDMTDELSQTQKEVIMGRVVMKKIGHPKDVAHTVAFLVSPMSQYVTGQVLYVDGGMY